MTTSSHKPKKEKSENGIIYISIVVCVILVIIGNAIYNRYEADKNEATRKQAQLHVALQTIEMATLIEQAEVAAVAGDIGEIERIYQLSVQFNRAANKKAMNTLRQAAMSINNYEKVSHVFLKLSDRDFSPYTEKTYVLSLPDGLTSGYAGLDSKMIAYVASIKPQLIADRAAYRLKLDSDKLKRIVDMKVYLKQKLDELDTFKSTYNFYETYGFVIGGPYNNWLTAIDKQIDNSDNYKYENQQLWNLRYIAFEFMNNQGRETEDARHFRKLLMKYLEATDLK